MQVLRGPRFPRLRRVVASIPILAVHQCLDLLHPVPGGLATVEVQLFERISDMPRRRRKESHKISGSTLRRVACALPETSVVRVQPGTHGGLLSNDMLPALVHLGSLTALNLQGQPLEGDDLMIAICTVPTLKSAVLSHNKGLNGFTEEGYTQLLDSAWAAPELVELDVHRTNMRDQVLEVLLLPRFTPALRRICIDCCEQLSEPDLRHLTRLEGVWINYIEHGCPTSSLSLEARQVIAPLRRHVHACYDDLALGRLAQFGIQLQ